MHEIKDDLGTLLYKILLFVVYIIVGLMGKISSMLLRGKKLSWYVIFGSMGIALFVGFMASAFCVWKGWDKEAKLIVPLATYTSDKVTLVLMKLNYRAIVLDVLESIKKRI